MFLSTIISKQNSNMSSNYNKISDFLFQKFKEIVGEDYFFNDKSILWTYAFGASVFEKDWMPELVLMPRRENKFQKF